MTPIDSVTWPIHFLWVQLPHLYHAVALDFLSMISNPTFCDVNLARDAGHVAEPSKPLYLLSVSTASGTPSSAEPLEPLLSFGFPNSRETKQSSGMI